MTTTRAKTAEIAKPAKVSEYGFCGSSAAFAFFAAFA